LFGKRQAQLLEQQLLVLVGLGVAAEGECPPVGGRQVNIDHLDGGELLERGTRGQARRQDPQALLEGDLQAVGEEGDKDVRLDAIIALMVDGADVQIALELFERLFYIPSQIPR
jgi:hypothetical protein